MILWVLAFAVAAGYICKVNIYEAFASGAKEGLETAVHILPYLASMLVAIHVMRDSGFLEKLYGLMSPAMGFLGLTEGVTPLLLIRPFSGSAALAVLSDTLAQYGADSRTGLLASTMMGSGETVFYTCALYLGAAEVRDSRYIIPVSLIAWVAGCIAAGFFFR
ncbi:MAG: spore maturation protein [Clostridia bacterium]|nr:spore maturation protein [Clostridia bacterium]